MKQSVETAQFSHENSYLRVRTAIEDAGPYIGGLIEAGGITDEEIATEAGLPLALVKRIRAQMVELGNVRDSGQRRPTTSGRKAIVWEVDRG